jgi:hypothetical protein
MADFSVKVTMTGLAKVSQQLTRLSSPEFMGASAAALNDVGFKVRREFQRELETVFDRPTPYIVRSVQVIKATAANQTVTIAPTETGGKGIDPQKILLAERLGGPRRNKRSENALQRIGVLPAGYQTVIPAEPWPGSHDGRGNIRGPFMTMLLTYFNAMGEQGYRSNMTDKTRAKKAQVGLTAPNAQGRRYKSINGVVFFVSYGKLRSKSPWLAPGIWAKRGIHGVQVSPVLLFVKSANYTPKLKPEVISKRAKIQTEFEKRLRYRIRSMVEAMR